MLRGTLLAESLRVGHDLRVADLKVTRIGRHDVSQSTVPPSDPADQPDTGGGGSAADQPDIWTFIEFEAPDERAGELVWLGGFASRVVLGSGTAASAAYALALGAAIWAAYDARWWLVTLCSVAGGAAYALSGRRWMRAYRARPAVHGRGESAAWLAVLTAAAIAGLALLLITG